MAKSLWLGSAAVLALTATSARTAEAPPPNAISEIVVTAQKREERLQEVPVSINVVAGETLDKLQVKSVSDLTSVSPSLSFATGTPRGGGLRIRGVGTTAGGSNAEPSVSYVVDGVVMVNQSAALDQALMDVARVEVLRGPQGTLFGKNASTGVVNIVTREASPSFEGRVEATAAEHGERQLQAAVSGPVTDALAFRLGYAHRELDGFMANRFDGSKVGGLNQESVRGKLQYRGEALDATLIADWNERKEDGLPFTERSTADPNRLALLARYGVTPSPDNDAVAVDAPNFAGRRWGGISLQIDTELAGQVLTWISAYREYKDLASNIDADGLPLSAQPSPITPAGSLNELFVEQQGSARGRTEQYSQEIRIASPPDQRFKYVAGLFALWTQDFGAGAARTVNQCLDIAANRPLPNSVATCSDSSPATVEGVMRLRQDERNDSKLRSRAAFGQAEYPVTDKLRLIAGLRYTDEHRSAVVWRGGLFDQSITFLTTPPAALRSALNLSATPSRPATTPITPGTTLSFPDVANTLVIGERSDDNWSGKAGLQYQWTPDAMTYFTAARGYKGPAFNVATGGYTDAELSDAYELGAKTSWLEGKLVANLALFHTTYDGFQSQRYDTGAGRYLVANAGEVRTRGFDADLIASPFEGLQVAASLSYARARIRSYGGAASCYAGQTVANTTASPTGAPPDDGRCYIIAATNPARPTYGQNIDGARLPGSPDWKANFNGQYEFTMPFEGVVGRLGANYTWQSEVLYDLFQDPSTRHKSYGVVDLTFSVAADDDRWEVTLFGKNVLDERFASAILYTPTLQSDFTVAAPSAATTPPTANPPPGNYVQVLPRGAFAYWGISLRYRFGD